MNTPEAARRLVDAFPELAAGTVVSITNGFDAADFAGPAPARAEDGAFRIVHTGTMHTEHRARACAGAAGCAGCSAGVHAPASTSCRARTSSLLEALRRWASRPEPARIGSRSHLAGAPRRRTTARSAAPRRSRGCPATARMRETIALHPHRRPALPAHAGPAAGRARRARSRQGLRVRSASGRPILAAVPDGDVREILGAAGTARFCRPADVGTMAAILRDELLRHRAGAPDRALDRDAIAPTSAARSRPGWPRCSTASPAPPAAALRHAA